LVGRNLVIGGENCDEVSDWREVVAKTWWKVEPCGACRLSPVHPGLPWIGIEVIPP
jgi:hypothetical protein